MAGLFVNIGVVEGIAVAADWRVRELTVHGWTKAMQALGLMPDLRKSLDILGFWSISSSRAYTVAGSFLRYLVDTYGIDKFWVLYASNNFERAYERPLDELVTEWEGFLEKIPLPKDDLLMAEHRFKRPGIFQKVCPHVSANTAARGYAPAVRRRPGRRQNGPRTDLRLRARGSRPVDRSRRSLRPSSAIRRRRGFGRASVRSTRRDPPGPDPRRRSAGKPRVATVSGSTGPQSVPGSFSSATCPRPPTACSRPDSLR